MQRRITVWGISLLVTFAVFAYLLSDVSIYDVTQLIGAVDRNLLLVFVVLSITGSYFRTWSYQLTLRISGYRVRELPLFLVVLVRNLFADLLPARIGTLVYIFLVMNRLAIPFESATSSFAVVFLFEIIALIPLLLLALLSAGVSAAVSPALLVLAVVIVSGSAALLLNYLPYLCGLFGRLVHELAFLKEAVRTRVRDSLFSIERDLEQLQRARIYGRLLGLSVMARLCKYISLYVFLLALLQPMKFSAAELPFGKVFMGIFSAEASASLPASGVAGFGLYEGTWSVAFQLLGFTKELASVTAISHHFFTQMYGYLLGIAALLLLLHPSMSSASTGRQEQVFRGSSVRFAIKVLEVTLLSILVGAGAYALPLTFAPHHTEVADIPDPAQMESDRRIAAAFPGRVLFDSNRSGSFGIYSVRADGTDLKTLADTELEEMYPDPSPDGSFIVFARARSTSRIAPSEVWLLNLKTGIKTRLTPDGNFPTFSFDGTRIIFERKRKFVYSVSLSGGDEKQLFPVKGNKDFSGYQVVKPRLAPDGKSLAFTSDKRGTWNAWLADLKTGASTHIGEGCEPAWYAGQPLLAYISEAEVKSESGIYSFAPAAKTQTELFDAGPPRGHEYFPSLAAQDRFLLFGSAPEGEHSHLDANYQIFIHDLSTKETGRVLYDTFTNRWPKLLKDG